PDRPVIDDPFRLRVVGLAPGQPVTVRAVLRDTAQFAIAAYATFAADEQGSVDLTTQAPRNGSYAGVDGMGLVWSADRAGAVDLPASYVPPAGENLDIQVIVEVNGAAVASRTIFRLLRAWTLRRVEVRDDGLAGTLLLPPGDGPFPGVIVLSGSD